MATAFSELSWSISRTITKAISGVSEPTTTCGSFTQPTKLAAGTGSGNCDLAPYDVANTSLPTGAPVTIDVRSYTVDGVAVNTMTKLKYFELRNMGTVDIEIGNAATGFELVGIGFLKAANDIITVAAGTTFIAPIGPAGMTVAAGIKDVMFRATSGTGSYRLIFAGSSS